MLAAAGAADAAVPSQNIGSPGGPLTSIAIGNELSCQVQHTGDVALEFFPSGATPGDCGTFVATGGALYAPDFANHDGTATGSLGTFTVSNSPAAGTIIFSRPLEFTKTNYLQYNF